MVQHPLKRYRQLWAQLKIIDGVLCRKYAPRPISETITVPILPANLRGEALSHNHDIPSAGHLGPNKTLDRLRNESYWVNMAQDVEYHCRNCTKCQQSKLPLPPRAPLMNIPIGQPWQMIAIDILEVPVSTNNNRYLLVVQDYFTKWADAIPLIDQTSARITQEVILFSIYGQPEIIHSDQGRNFESSILTQTLEVIDVNKSHTTAYHPQGNGMVERFNRTLLQLLRSYVEKLSDWERYLHLVLYAYRTSTHSSTGFSPFLLMYGRSPAMTPFSQATAFDTTSYPAYLRAKLAELKDFLDSNLATAAAQQKSSYDQHTFSRSFEVGDEVWLSVMRAGKLDPRWEGRWKVKTIKSPVTIEISDGKRTKVVHINRLQHRYQPSHHNQIEIETSAQQTWNPPGVDHIYLPPPPISTRRYPARERNPPNWLRFLRSSGRASDWGGRM